MIKTPYRAIFYGQYNSHYAANMADLKPFRVVTISKMEFTERGINICVEQDCIKVKFCFYYVKFQGLFILPTILLIDTVFKPLPKEYSKLTNKAINSCLNL